MKQQTATQMVKATHYFNVKELPRLLEHPTRSEFQKRMERLLDGEERVVQFTLRDHVDAYHFAMRLRAGTGRDFLVAQRGNRVIAVRMPANGNR